MYNNEGRLVSINNLWNAKDILSNTYRDNTTNEYVLVGKHTTKF